MPADRCHNPGPAALFVAAALLAAGVACGHDWTANRDVADAADAPADDVPVPEDGTADEAVDVFHDELVPNDVPVDVVPDGGPADVGADDAAPPDAGADDAPTDTTPPCLMPTGHDEDEDGVDDGCDNCPTYANAGQEDGDDDGLGDACEEPGRPALFSTVVGFDPFVSSSTDSGLDWHVWQGTWTTLDDYVVGSAAPTAGNYLWTTPVDAPLAVEAQFRFVSDVSTGPF